ncbi:MAG TPA: nucleoside hydrolase [Propionicimonas sp.]|nr:nucleoside hydrolase [Propionicimonas sp.]HRA06355.1 nucleoside hydrolase [Propionicimonas sp.]
MPQPTWRIGEWPWLPIQPSAQRVRVIVDNDFAGDPDDLYQLAHHLLSPSVDIRGIVCSHLRPDDPFYPGADSADAARRVVEDLAAAMRLDLAGRVYTGSNLALTSRTEPQDSEAARFIVAEAMRDEPGLAPLFFVAGGGLTDLAAAYLIEPRIAPRMTVVWIGGPEHEGLGYAPPEIESPEYNLRIDVTAGQVVFNDSDLPLWLVPRNMYRQCLVSDVELRHRVAAKGELGAYLYAALRKVAAGMEACGAGYGETYALGDSPLVLLTALQSFFQPDPSSSDHAVRPCPELDDQGLFTDRTGRDIRVYHRLDVRLMFEDMFLKFDELASWLAAH